ncbi:MAG: glycosyltransferase [candidate division Zixibacteria bacterium]|nr:glycosyltransferase [candidate division Zixibacteria bacterium]
MGERLIKVAYFIDTIESPSAGTEQQLLMLLNNLDRNRFEPHLICLRDSKWLKSQSLPFSYDNLNFTKLFSYDFFRFAMEFRKLHKVSKFDIVQTFFTDANIAGTIAARLAGCKIIIASRRNSLDRLSGAQLKMLRFLKRYTTIYLANSKAIACATAAIEGAGLDRYKTIYNGMYLEKFNEINNEMRTRQRAEWKIADDDTLIGLTANLRSVKNIDSLIRAAAKLNNDFKKLKFVVVGEGPRREELQGLIDESGLSTAFKLAGRYSNIVPCLSAFDIGVLCSKAEGFSNSLIEYMAAGLPVVASDVGGNAEAISHNTTGLIYSLDEPNSLINALRNLVEDRALAKSLGEKARKEATNKYDVNKYIKNHEEFYIDIIGQR